MADTISGMKVSEQRAAAEAAGLSMKEWKAQFEDSGSSSSSHLLQLQRQHQLQRQRLHLHQLLRLVRVLVALVVLVAPAVLVNQALVVLVAHHRHLIQKRRNEHKATILLVECLLKNSVLQLKKQI